MKNKFTLALAALLVSGFCAEVLAVPPPPTRPPLTPAQVSKIRRSAKPRTLSPQQQEMKQLTDQLRAELKKNPVDQAKIDDLTKQIDDRRNAMQVERMQSMLNNPNLTPQQKQRYNDMLQRMKSRQGAPKTAPQPPAK